MTQISVGVNGYGTIGKRVADAVVAQPDMTVSGVAKTRPSFEAQVAGKRGFPLYAAVEENVPAFDDAGIELAGSVDEMVAKSDVVVDATPSGVGESNRTLYEAHDTPAVFQGGEDPDVASVSFNARANFEAAAAADYVRVVSCNTTGLSRVIAPVDERYGIEKVRATLVRRGSDPAQSDRGPINDILPDPVEIPSHHARDVRTIFPDLDIDTLGLKVPATQMHVHSLNLTLEAEATDDDVADLLAGESRVRLITDDMAIEGCGSLKEFARDVGRPRGDLWENCVWAESIQTQGRDLYMFQAIHQESDVVPENVDAVRAITNSADARESVGLTNETLDVEGRQ